MFKRLQRVQPLLLAVMLWIGLTAGATVTRGADLENKTAKPERSRWMGVVADVVGTIGSYLTGEDLTINKTNRDEIYEFLTDELELNTAAACGILANMARESKFNPDLVGDDGTSRGLCQWHNSRWDSLESWCEENGYDCDSLEGQLRYLQFELSANDHRVLYNGQTIYDTLKEAEDTQEGAYEAARYWCMYYEVPLNRETVSVERATLARNTYWPRFSEGK